MITSINCCLLIFDRFIKVEFEAKNDDSTIITRLSPNMVSIYWLKSLFDQKSTKMSIEIEINTGNGDSLPKNVQNRLLFTAHDFWIILVDFQQILPHSVVHKWSFQFRCPNSLEIGSLFNEIQRLITIGPGGMAKKYVTRKNWSNDSNFQSRIELS